MSIGSSLFANIELAIGGAKTEVLEAHSTMNESVKMRDLILSKINNKPNESNGISASDEISKFYNLKEKGIITEEEFESKKKQLLNL